MGLLKKTIQGRKNYFSILKELILNNKKKTALYFTMVFVIFMVAFVMANNYNWYDKTIVRIETETHIIVEEVETNQGLKEVYYDQTLRGKIMNGPLKGEMLMMNNTYTASGVFDEQYNVSDEVFVEIQDTQPLTGRIDSLKRDKYLVIPFSILLVLMLLLIRKKSIFTILSLTINVFIFYYALDLYERGIDLLLISQYMMVVFTVLSLVLISGFRKKTLAAILATLMTITIMAFVINLFVRHSNDLDFSYMAYIFSPNNLDVIFKAQLLIAGLGAIMDIAIMMATMVNELVTKNPMISYKDLWHSGRELGYDVMGAMINVMLFTYFCGSIPMIVLKMKMEIRLSTIVLYHMPMELYRFLFGGLGLMIAIPISLLVSIALLKKGRP